MSDFIFSTNNIEKNIITTEIQSIYHDDKPVVQEFHGNWGSLGVSRNLYHGFNPYENEQFIVIIIGGPILKFRENNFLGDKNSLEGTKAIFQRWKAGEMIWDRDLTGPFTAFFINKETGKATFVTDLMSFIPVFRKQKNKEVYIGTHVDVLATISNANQNIDKVSLVDFILNGITTYPYTLYNNVMQIHPGTINTIYNYKIEQSIYWLPKETYSYGSISEAAYDLRESIAGYIELIKKETTNIAQFISGGEDSRVLSGMLDFTNRDGFVFLDAENREGKIAERVSRRHNIKLNIKFRTRDHYLNFLPNSSKLVGTGSQYTHVHSIGFNESCNLLKYDAVFGGLFSDALIKGVRIKKKNAQNRLPFLPQVKDKKYTALQFKNNNIFPSQIVKEIRNRRKAHLNYIKTFRPDSSIEWLELWPSSMNRNIPNIHGNRRLFRSFEPFMIHEIVKVSAFTPQKWKLNRKLFHRSMKPFLEKTKFIPHSDGRYPVLKWYANVLPHFITWFYIQAGRKTGILTKSQDSWTDWSEVSTSQEFQNMYEENRLGLLKINDIIGEKLSGKEFGLNAMQRLTLLQLMYLLR